MRPPLSVILVLALGGAAAAAPQPLAPAVSPKLFSGLHWRSIGPYRGGRVLAVAGVPGDPSTDKRRPVGDNPPQGAVFDYWLANEPKGEVAIEILDGKGALVRKLSSAVPNRGPEQPPEWIDLVRTPDQLAKHAGMNRFVWDLRWSEPTQIPGAFYQGLPPWGPLALPGTYTVKLTAGGKPQTAPLVIFNDPRSKATEADLRASFDLQLKVRALIDALHVAVDQIRSTRAQTAVLRTRLGGSAQAKELVAAIDAIAKAMDAVEGQLVQVKLGSCEGMLRFPSMLNEQLDSFRGSIESDRAPTQPQLELYADLAKRVEAQVAVWKALATSNIPALNKKVVTSGVALIDPTAPGSVPPAPAGGRAAPEQDRERDRF